jgi:hypothetical protein
MESTMVITAGWHETKQVSVNSYINVSSELMVEFVNSILVAFKFMNQQYRKLVVRSEKFYLKQEEK